MQFWVVNVFAGMVLAAIGWVVRFAQVLCALLCLCFQCLPLSMILLKLPQICYNCDRSRICTLKTKYDILSERGRLQSL